VTSDAGAVARAALELGSATLGESGARRMHPRIKPIWKGARIAAPAFPVRCTPGDNLALHVAVARAPEGSALVADMGGTRDFGYWGEVLTTGAEARGLTALVIDACVRDCDALEAHGFPVFATGLALTGAGKTLAGSLREPVTVGDVDVELGDWVVGDTDGVVVIPGGELDAVLAAGRARADKEAGLFAALRAGATTLELLDLDPGPVQG
jgi:4-hydroxy-4-methyl-2-oxoglutarate aldolase